MPDPCDSLARRISDAYAQDERVEAVTWSGSRTSGATVDAASDIDLYVYTATGDLPLAARQNVLDRLGGAARANMGMPYWGDSDLWIDPASGVEVDVVYPSRAWLEQAVDTLLHNPSPPGDFATGFWHVTRTARILYDPTGWFAQTQAACDVPYPEPLRRAIIARNLPVLRQIIPSYKANIAKSLPRSDLIFINNEVTWLLDGYFNVLFAFNRAADPGAKRLIEQALRLCPQRPARMAEDIAEILRLAAAGDPALLVAVDRLVDGIEALVGEEFSL